jgi:hypothetical protein
MIWKALNIASRLQGSARTKLKELAAQKTEEQKALTTGECAGAANHQEPR